jgi:hypothetical protein
VSQKICFSPHDGPSPKRSGSYRSTFTLPICGLIDVSTRNGRVADHRLGALFPELATRPHGIKRGSSPVAYTRLIE